MAVINILDKHTAELIAAGEVVERPASVVKELVENAVDAGSTKIVIRIERGGVGLIEVQDNGCGIEPEEVGKAFIRHATSKIRTGADLDKIGTLGFRGEALASIAAVSRVTLVTCTPSAEYAVRYTICGGEEQEILPDARPVGTTITVRDLFYNTPARMKFLKKDQSEANLVQDVVTHLALSHPEVSFSFLREGREIFQTPGDQKLLSAIYAVQGREFAKDLLPVEQKEGSLEVKGYITPPKGARGSRSMQFFYINGRYVKNRTMMAALEAACKGYVMAGKFPGCVLNLTLPPQAVDVNVHPAKTEVRFANEKAVFQIVYQAARAAVSAPQAAEKWVQLDTPSAGKDKAAQKPEAQETPVTEIAEKPISFTSVPPSTKEAQKTLQDLHSLYDGALRSQSPVTYRVDRRALDIAVADEREEEHFSKAAEQKTLLDIPPVSDSPLPQAPQTADGGSEPPVYTKQEPAAPAAPSAALRLIGEAFKTYIIAQKEDALVFIDKHAAHERLLYEKLLAGLGGTAAQTLLCPVNITLSGEEKNALLQEKELVEGAGLDVEDFGGNTVLVRAVPPNVTEGEVAPLVEEIAEKLARGTRDARSEKQEWVYASIACRGAIKAGDRSADLELLALAEDVMSGKVPRFCPHGRPIVLKLTQKEIEKYFGRLG